jgi:uracil-DNA glycosylase
MFTSQKLSGIGNYILSECLYRARIDPFASLQELTEEQLRNLFREAQAVALESYSSQGLTREGGTFRGVEGEAGNFQFQLQCYGRETCARGNPVVRETDGPHKRAIWYTTDQLFMPLEERIRRVDELSSPKKAARPNNDEGTVIRTEANDATKDTGTGDNKLTSYGNTDLIAELKDQGWIVKGTDIRTKANDATKDTGTGGNKLTSYGNTDLIAELKDQGWKNALSDAIDSDSFQNLQSFLTNENASGATIYPPPEDVFAALNLCPFEKIKVVIVGQDPYHGPGQGHGLAFSVRKGVNPPPSLKNIFKEAMNDASIAQPPHGNLEHWAQQGVLLLNTVLTVRRGEANSHKGQGWEDFTDEVIRALNDQKDEGLVFLLWGNPASKKAATVDETKHVIIRTSHPSPLGATKTASPFLGSNCFSRCNEALEAMGHAPIDWNVV